MDQEFSVSLKKCTVMGGAGYLFNVGAEVDLLFGADKVTVVQEESAQIKEVIPYFELAEISISGPGNVKTGGGFIGGGFGVEGAIEGMAISSVLNLLTTRSKIHTFISLVTHPGELHLHYSGMEPSALRIALSETFAALRRLNPIWLRSGVERLDTYRKNNATNEAEYEISKQRLFSPPPKPITPLTLAAQIAALPTDQKGECPVCAKVIPLLSAECPKCKALFGGSSLYKIKPMAAF